MPLTTGYLFSHLWLLINFFILYSCFYHFIRGKSEMTTEFSAFRTTLKKSVQTMPFVMSTTVSSFGFGQYLQMLAVIILLIKICKTFLLNFLFLQMFFLQISASTFLARQQQEDIFYSKDEDRIGSRASSSTLGRDSSKLAPSTPSEALLAPCPLSFPVEEMA